MFYILNLFLLKDWYFTCGSKSSHELYIPGFVPFDHYIVLLLCRKNILTLGLEGGDLLSHLFPFYKVLQQKGNVLQPRGPLLLASSNLRSFLVCVSLGGNSRWCTFWNATSTAFVKDRFHLVSFPDHCHECQQHRPPETSPHLHDSY